MNKVLDVRQCFLEFFKKKSHKLLPSSSIIPFDNDSSSLFVNSGMQQFKNYFTGVEQVKDLQIATSQVCIRAGGKHNDLENVGFTARHHTMFEMLGNFAFNNVYFKREAIELAWEFLVQELKIDSSRLYITVYHTDDEAFEIWKDVLKNSNLSADRIIKIATDDNFWSMAKDYGPCGPCTEIFYDFGSEVPGGKPGSKDEDGDRYIEIWNIVFMEYEKKDGKLVKLHNKGIDTGMGLERLTAVVENKKNNYETSIFTEIINIVNKVLHVKRDDNNIFSFRVIADHMRSSIHMIAAGIVPLNEGRGYILKKIIRRMLLHLNKLLEKRELTILDKKNTVEQLIIDILPSIHIDNVSVDQICKIIIGEIQKFDNLLISGQKILVQEINRLQEDDSKQKMLRGEFVFRLYDTYGFPVELVNDFLKDLDITIDHKGFEKCMELQKENSKCNEVFNYNDSTLWSKYNLTEFLGYKVNCCEAKCIDIVNNEMIIFDQTVFYAESGGQKGDQGKIIYGNRIIYIKHTISPVKGLFVHIVDKEKTENFELFSNELIGKTMQLSIDTDYRLSCSQHHTATHLLHSVLRKELGEYVQQQGSVVSHNKFTFDYNCNELINICHIEKLMNNLIMRGGEVVTRYMKLDEAMSSGAIGLFNEKYAEKVRVVSIGNDISKELCGGTHVQNIKDIRLFKIISNKTIASGIRRIEAVCDIYAIEYLSDAANKFLDLVSFMKTYDVKSKIIALQDEVKQCQKKMDNLELSYLQLPYLSSSDKEIESIGPNIDFYKIATNNISQKNIIRFIKKYLSANKEKVFILQIASSIFFIGWNAKYYDIQQKILDLLKQHTIEQNSIITMGQGMIQIQKGLNISGIKKILQEVIND